MSLWGTIRTSVRAELEEPTAGTWLDASLLTWANEAAQYVARNSKPIEDEEYVNSVANQRSYDLPTGTLEVRAVMYDTAWVPRSTMTEWGDLTATGTPVTYDISDEALYFYPIPSTAASMRFFRYALPTAMTASTDAMPFSGKYDTAIKCYVKSQAFEQIGDWESAERMRTRWLDALSDANSQARQERYAQKTYSPRQDW